jgi:1,2-dihydroxy-3-keto-5-methylthiopentene dioxygenase
MKANWLEGDGASISAEGLIAQGLLYQLLPTEPEAHQGELDALMAERGYLTRDVVELRPDTPNLDAICDKFVGEHHHTEDEVRFVLDGEGIFDIRSNDDRWMRVVVEPGDLLVVPANRHHRFLLTDMRSIRCVRLFQDPAGWVAHYREV